MIVIVEGKTNFSNKEVSAWESLSNSSVLAQGNPDLPFTNIMVTGNHLSKHAASN